MKTPRIASLILAGAALVVLRPATAACPASADLVDIDRPAIAATAASAPEHPIVAFERMLAPRTPVAGAPVAVEHPDPLTASFQATLWTLPDPLPIAPTASLDVNGGHK